MHKLNLKFILLFVIIIKAMPSFCQGHYPVIVMELSNTPIAGNFTTDGQPDISDTTVFNTKMKITISDTAYISKLHVVLKREQTDGSALLTKNFDFDVSGTFGDGTSYTRTGYDITLNLGNFMGMISPYAELIIENSANNLSDPIIYN